MQIIGNFWISICFNIIQYIVKWLFVIVILCLISQSKIKKNKYKIGLENSAKLQNTGPLIYILLNHNSAYCVPLRSSKGFDTCKTGGPKWPYIL